MKALTSIVIALGLLAPLASTALADDEDPKQRKIDKTGDKRQTYIKACLAK